MWPPLPRCPRGYRGNPALPITVHTSSLQACLHTQLFSLVQCEYFYSALRPGSNIATSMPVGVNLKK